MNNKPRMLTEGEIALLRQDLRDTIAVLRLAESFVGAAIAQGALVDCAMYPQTALKMVSDMREKLMEIANA